MIVYNSIGTHRHYDDNGYLYIDESPVLKSGVLEYLGSEIMDKNGEVDGVKVENDRIYKVYLPLEELERAKDTFNMKPITDNHTWLGDEGKDAKHYQQGMTGEKSEIKDNMLYVSMAFTGREIIDDIKNGKVELSASYTNRLEKSDSPEYDFIARDYVGNHIALVDRGRCGENVRVLNNTKEDLMSKVNNEATLEIDGKKVDLEKFVEEEAQEGEHEESISLNEDKRAIIDEIGGILKDKGLDEEIIRTILKKAEELAYNPSEESEADNSCGDEEKAENDEEEVIEAKEETEEKPAEEEVKEEKEEIKTENSYSKIYNKVMEDIKAGEEAKKKAYNSAEKILGAFNPFGMTAKDMLVKALNYAGVSVNGEESEKELNAMLKVCNMKSKVDNSFSYDVGSEEMEVNF